MCGIAGLLRLDQAPVDFAALHRMAALIRHRGPDGQGFAAFPAEHTEPVLLWRDERRPPSMNNAPVALAHRRLAILDLTEAGHQPMSSVDGRYWTVLNGEIYNHAELRATLSAKGHAFRGRSDTEVLLAAWSEWGEACLERLEGMFAFALWDWPGHRLFLVRDRFGIKPLYYGERDGAFAFASEIKPVLSALSLPVRTRDEAAYELLVRGQKDHRGTTFFEGVMQVPAGHLLEVQSRSASPRPWYDRVGAVLKRLDSPGGYRASLEAAVCSHLVSDVPVGGCLSGGLDSSAIAGIASRTLPFLTFSARSADPALDEGRWQEAQAKHLGLENRAVVPDAPGFWDALPDLLWFQEEPFTTGSLYAQWRVMQEASAQGVKVMLDGQGADELLGGYPGMLPLARPLSFRSILEVLGLSPLAREWAESRRHRFLQPELVRRPPDPLEPPVLPGLFRSERLRQTLLHLPALLHYEDRNAMAFGVEARVPYLDRAAAEIALALPTEALLAGGRSKEALRLAAGDRLAPEVRDRTDKIGFATADAAWMRAGEPRVREMVDGLARSGSPWVDWKAVLKSGSVPMPLLLVDLWRSRALSPGFLEPRA